MSATTQTYDPAHGCAVAVSQAAGTVWNQQPRGMTSRVVGSAVQGDPQSPSVECEESTPCLLERALIMTSTKNYSVTTRQGDRDHGAEAQAVRKTAEVIASVRLWARRCDHRLHRG